MIGDVSFSTVRPYSSKGQVSSEHFLNKHFFNKHFFNKHLCRLQT